MSLSHTPQHVDCPACEEQRQLIVYADRFGEQLFPAAATSWLSNRRGLSDRQRQHYVDYIRQLGRFFGHLTLKEIHIGNIVSYQRARQENIRQSRRHKATNRSGKPLESDGASVINHEISCLGQVLKLAGLWEAIAKFYEPIPLRGDSAGVCLMPEEEAELFRVAKTRTKWMVAYCCALVSRNTTAGPGEIRNLRLGDVALGTPQGSFVHVIEGVKNAFRKRPLPLNSDAERAVRWLLDRAHRLGACAPEHYLLPHRAANRRGKADPTRPMGSWRRAHRSMCEEAAKKFPRLAYFRCYDYRHTACTNMLEDPAISYTTIEHMMGHRLGSNTKRKYDHLRNSALRVAAEALNRHHAEAPVVEMPRRKPPAEVMADYVVALPGRANVAPD